MVTIVWFTDGEKYVEPHQRSWEVTEEVIVTIPKTPVLIRNSSIYPDTDSQ